ncbi:hypothetical protein FOA52_008938 [Chlamydomonas sp. UWO 241]|nr:hypothetical protein FOA52_008938 [Chlamydomonas sp. UWO 241]
MIPYSMHAALLCALLCAVTGGASANPYVSYKAKMEMAKLVESEGVSDPFSKLPEAGRKEWHAGRGRSIARMVAEFSSVPTRVIIEVKLVGFDGKAGGGDHNIHVKNDDLAKHLDSLQRELESVVLQPELKALAVKPSVSFVVSRAPRQLIENINLAVSNAMHAEQGRAGRADDDEFLLNYEYVDRVIAHDAEQSRGVARAAALAGTAAITVYLLNPQARLPVEYLYSYEDYGDAKAHSRHGCPGTLYVSDSHPAYAWIDIRAGPAAYGPGAGHRGQVLAHSLPHPSHYKASQLDLGIVPDLAALVWSATQHMAWPPVLHEEIARKPSVHIQIVHMHDTLGPPPDRLDQQHIASQLRLALDGMQDVSVKEIWLPFAHCDVCVAAYASALKLRTAREDGGLYISAKTSKILDRQALHAALQDHADSIMTGFPEVGINSGAASHFTETTSATRHVIPVFVFDISDSGKDALLIDGAVKATAFSDMVVAVSSRAAKAPSHFTCRLSACEPVAGNITREVLAALLTSGWGVPDTATYFSAGAGQGEDYRWSVGNTPFGPLSHRCGINAALSHTMQRNQVVLELQSSVEKVLRLLDGFSKLSTSGKLDAATCKGHFSTVPARINVAYYKLSEAALLLGQWQTKRALALARSMSHDVHALERAARAISAALQGTVKCDGAPELASVWWAPCGALALWPLAAWVRSMLARSQRKRVDKIY